MLDSNTFQFIWLWSVNMCFFCHYGMYGHPYPTSFGHNPINCVSTRKGEAARVGLIGRHCEKQAQCNGNSIPREDWWVITKTFHCLPKFLARNYLKLSVLVVALVLYIPVWIDWMSAADNGRNANPFFFSLSEMSRDVNILHHHSLPICADSSQANASHYVPSGLPYISPWPKREVQ